jgi:hypothetical protein
MHNRPDDGSIWIQASHHKSDGTIGHEMLVLFKPWNSSVSFRIDAHGRSTEYTIKEEDAQLISAFLAPRPDLKVVRDE